MRILYLEDNPLLAFHVEQMIEDLGYVSVGSLSSFAELQKKFESLQFDAALVDIDLDDGPTGPEAAAWLQQRGIPAIFVTGQAEVAAGHHDISLGFIEKPISPSDFAKKVELFRSRISRNS